MAFKVVRLYIFMEEVIKMIELAVSLKSLKLFKNFCLSILIMIGFETHFFAFLLINLTYLN